MNTTDIGQSSDSTSFSNLSSTTLTPFEWDNDMSRAGMDADVERLFQITSQLQKAVTDLSDQINLLRNRQLTTDAQITVLRNLFYKKFEE